MSSSPERTTAAHRRYRRLSRTVAGLSFSLAAGTLIADEVAEQSAARAREDDFYRSAEVFSEIFHEIQQKYVEEIDTDSLMEAAIRGMFESLDPHSAYMGSELYDQLTQSTQGEFFGIGIHITRDENGVLTVIAPIANTPSARLGVQPWDRIIEIEGESTEGMSLSEAVRRLKGPEGTQVRIKVFRAPEAPGEEGQVLEFTITRAKIEILSVFSQVLEERVGYLRLAQFSEETGRDLREHLRGLIDQGVQALILDLRFNTGGLLNQAIEVCDLFLPEGATVVKTDGRLPTSEKEYLCNHIAFTDLPMLVLVNEGSASASEIVAGALQDHGRALVVGPQDGVAPSGHEDGWTFGKGSVQTIEELEHALELDDEGRPRPSAIRLTTAHYFTPDGHDIHKRGIQPDIMISVPPGHERELFRRGLLGDPDTVEPEDHQEAVRNGLNDEGGVGEATDVSPEAEEGEEAPEDSVVVIDPHAEETREEPFRDILLDEAVRHMRIYLMMQHEIS